MMHFGIVSIHLVIGLRPLSFVLNSYSSCCVIYYLPQGASKFIWPFNIIHARTLNGYKRGWLFLPSLQPIAIFRLAVVADPGPFHKHLRSAIDEFGIGQLHVDHPVVFDPANQDHGHR